MPRGVYKRIKPNPLKGIPRSLEVRMKISAKRKGIAVRKGFKMSEDHKRKISESHLGKKLLSNSGELNYLWKGNKVTYSGLHHWVKSKLGTPSKCECCKTDGLSGKMIHWANKSQKYKRDTLDWLRLCAKCHKKYDKNKLKTKPDIRSYA